MKKFYFNLESVLRYRIDKERKQQIVVRRVQQRLFDAQKTHQDIQRSLQNLIKKMSSEYTEMAAHELHAGSVRLEYLTKILEESKQKIQSIEQEIQEAKKILHTIWKERESVHRLKERSARKHLQESLIYDQKISDELNLRRHSYMMALSSAMTHKEK